MLLLFVFHYCLLKVFALASQIYVNPSCKQYTETNLWHFNSCWAWYYFSALIFYSSSHFENHKEEALTAVLFHPTDGASTWYLNGFIRCNKLKVNLHIQQCSNRWCSCTTEWQLQVLFLSVPAGDFQPSWIIHTLGAIHVEILCGGFLFTGACKVCNVCAALDLRRQILFCCYGYVQNYKSSLLMLLASS